MNTNALIENGKRSRGRDLKQLTPVTGLRLPYSRSLHDVAKSLSTVRRLLAVCILLSAANLPAAEPTVTLNVQEKWADVFAGKKAVYHAGATASEVSQARIGWQFSISGGTVARGEQAIALAPVRPAIIEIPLDIPAVKDGTAVQGKLSLAVYPGSGGKAVATLDKDIWIFPDDPFFLKKEFLAAAKIRVFDPEKKTAALFEQARIPFGAVTGVDTFSEITDGILIVGEGVSFKDYRGLGEMMVRTAARGVPVLCLSPAGGEMSMPGAGDTDLPRPACMRFEGNGIITSLDKRIDAEAWPPDGNVNAGGMKLRGERGPVVAETARANAWPWIEMDFSGRGKLVICGFGIVERWNTGPAPGLLFQKILEYMTEKK